MLIGKDSLDLELRQLADPNTAVVFDLGRVLLDYDFTVLLRYLAKVSGRTLEDVDRIYCLHYDKHIRGQVQGAWVLDQLARELGIQPEHFSRHYDQIYSPTPIVDLVWRYKSRFHSVHLFSNISDLHAEFITSHWPQVFHPFDNVWLSYRVRVAKPDREMFQFVEKMIPGASSYILVDDMEKNIQGANEHGWRGVHFRCRSPSEYGVAPGF